MAKSSLILVVFATSSVLGWTPVAGPMKAFSIKQQHPPHGSSIIEHKISIDDSSTEQSAEDRIGDVFHVGNEEEVSLGHDTATLGDGSPIESSAGYFGNKLFGSGGGFYKEDTCSVEKYALEGDGTVRYQNQLTKLDQFTLCAWTRYTNHSGDHTIFTYSVEHEPREIQLWVANANGASFISLAVHGQSLFRLNYPLRFRRWHHMCASWNGKTGEWQLWVRAERVGRGFHNRLVGHVIPANGFAYSGGPSITGKTGEGLHFELTLIQLYKVALSAGKAHRDHKHHHVHKFDHNGPVTTVVPPSTQAPPSPLPANPLLANGQIPQRVRLNLAGGAQPNSQNVAPVQGLPSQLAGNLFTPANNPVGTITTQFVNGQFHVGQRTIQEQLVAKNLLSQSQTTIVFPGPTSPPSVSAASNDLNDGNYQYFSRQFKREVSKRGISQLPDGSYIDDSLVGGDPSFLDGLAQFGAQSFRDQLGKRQNDLEEEIKEHDREPAEDEVGAVIALCSKCDLEPFAGAVVLAWKELRTVTEHALKAKSQGGCGDF